MAGEPGHRHCQSVDVERLQLGRRSHVHGAALHDESARPLALGCREWDPLNPLCLGAADDVTTGIGQVCGGTIVFGGGVALFKGQTRVGGLGVSGDTACADHEIAKRVRLAAGLAPNGLPTDEIVYTAADGPSPFAHPLCPNTFRDGSKIGDESPAAGY